MEFQGHVIFQDGSEKEAILDTRRRRNAQGIIINTSSDTFS